MSKNTFIINDFSILDKERKLGISGHLRIKNQGFLIDRCIKSCLPFLDELIITFNECTDDTVEILDKYRNNKKIKIYNYPFSVKFDKKKVTSVEETCANYYNFGLTKINFSHYMKIDCDQFYNTYEMLKVRKLILKKSNFNKIFYFCGVNVFLKNYDPFIYIGTRFNNFWLSPFNGGFDHFCFVPNSKTYYSNIQKTRYTIEIMNNIKQMESIKISSPLWMHFGSFKYNFYFEKKANKNNSISFKNLHKITNEANVIFFNKKFIMYKKSWFIFLKIMYVVLKKILEKTNLYFLSNNDYEKIIFYESVWKNIDEIEQIYNIYEKFIFEIYNNFNLVDISLLSEEKRIKKYRK